MKWDYFGAVLQRTAFETGACVVIKSIQVKLVSVGEADELQGL